MQVLQENGRYQFVHQDAPVLGVVLEFDDIEVAVIRFQQVGLGPSAHLSDMPAGGERHGKCYNLELYHTPEETISMTEEKEEPAAPPAPPARTKDEIALELTKFISATTGYGKGGNSSAGFSGKPAARSAEEYAEALLELFERCRAVVNK